MPVSVAFRTVLSIAFWKSRFEPIVSARSSTTKSTTCGTYQGCDASNVTAIPVGFEKPPFWLVVTAIVPPVATAALSSVAVSGAMFACGERALEVDRVRGARARHVDGADAGLRLERRLDAARADGRRVPVDRVGRDRAEPSSPASMIPLRFASFHGVYVIVKWSAGDAGQRDDLRLVLNRAQDRCRPGGSPGRAAG